MIKGNAIDIEVSSKSLERPCKPFQELHPASCRKSKGNEIQSAYNPESAVAGEFLKIDAQQVKHVFLHWACHDPARISRNCFSRLFF